MIKWEYEWVRPGDLNPEDMAKMGWRGWEFAGTLGGDWVIFKRPVVREGLECKCQPAWPPYAMVARRSDGPMVTTLKRPVVQEWLECPARDSGPDMPWGRHG